LFVWVVGKNPPPIPEGGLVQVSVVVTGGFGSGAGCGPSGSSGSKLISIYRSSGNGSSGLGLGVHGSMKMSSVISVTSFLGITGHGTGRGPSQMSGVLSGSLSCMPSYSWRLSRSSNLFGTCCSQSFSTSHSESFLVVLGLSLAN
jgi:hypothetical protein